MRCSPSAASFGSRFSGGNTTRCWNIWKFYADASFIIRNHSFREAPWNHYHKVVDDLLASYGVPGNDALS
jgi:hypothetical protein